MIKLIDILKNAGWKISETSDPNQIVCKATKVKNKWTISPTYYIENQEEYKKAVLVISDILPEGSAIEANDGFKGVMAYRETNGSQKPVVMSEGEECIAGTGKTEIEDMFAMMLACDAKIGIAKK